MKFSAAAGIWLAVQLLGAVEASISCTTDYGSKSVKHLSTETSTTQTTVVSTITKVKTTTTKATSTSVFTVTNSSSTYTVPTPDGFKPLISAGSVQPSWTDPPRRDVKDVKRTGFARSAAPTSYPQDVRCTKTITKQRKTTVKSTSTSTRYVSTVTTTEEVAASTVLAACMADNLLTSFHHRPIQAARADHALPYCFSGSSGSSQRCTSAYDCCAHVISDAIYSGFSYSAGNCYALAGNPMGYGDWEFYSGSNDGTVFGNGAYGGGVFGGACSAHSC